LHGCHAERSEASRLSATFEDEILRLRLRMTLRHNTGNALTEFSKETSTKDLLRRLRENTLKKSGLDISRQPAKFPEKIALEHSLLRRLIEQAFPMGFSPTL
jgi:hypothetical protein